MGDIDTFQLRAAFVQAQAQIMNGGTYEPVVLISKPLALSLLDEIERLRRWKAEASTVIPNGPAPIVVCERETLLAEVERLRTAGDAADQYVADLGVDWCVLHHGVRNEDSDRCDAFDWCDDDSMTDEDGEYLPCDLRPLAYRKGPSDAYQEARRG